MRKFLFDFNTDGVVFPWASPSILSVEATPAPISSMIPLPPLLSPHSTGPSDKHPFFFFPSVPISDSFFDVATLAIIAGLLLLCILSFSMIFHLCLRSHRWHHLQNFNSLWTTRLLLVSFASCWALIEMLRLGVFRRQYLFPFLPSLTLDQQADLCKIHQVLSLGFFEPGFLVTLLFLVNVSIRKRLPHRMWALGSICLACAPLFVLQTLFVFFPPLETRLPRLMHESFIRFTDPHGKSVVLCKYPLFSSLVFGAFSVGYLLAFLISSWRVVAFVINKNIRARINTLASTVMIALPLQVLCLALSVFWTPDNPAYSFVVLAMFLCVTCVVAAAEVVLVIVPITEALAAGVHSCPWRPNASPQQSEVES